MATAVLGSGSHNSPWDKIKDEKYPSRDHWSSSNGSGWGTGGWNENGGWRSGSGEWGSGTGGWGSGTGKLGEWGSGTGDWGSSGGKWGSSKNKGGWGSTGDAWRNGESSSSGSRKRPTLTDLWSGSTGEKRSESFSWKPSSLTRDVEPELPSSTSPRMQSEDDSSAGWGSTNERWGTGTGGVEMNSVAGTEENAKDDLSPLFSPERSTWAAHATTSLDPQSRSNFRGQQANSIDDPGPISSHHGAFASISQPRSQLHGFSHSYSFPQSYFTTLSDGSSEYRPYPNTYDIRAMWADNYTGQYSSIDFSASSSAIEKSIDRNLERYYWDLRYQSEVRNVHFLV